MSVRGRESAWMSNVKYRNVVQQKSTVRKSLYDHDHNTVCVRRRERARKRKSSSAALYAFADFFGQTNTTIRGSLTSSRHVVADLMEGLTTRLHS
jgi:hypothetical protein